VPKDQLLPEWFDFALCLKVGNNYARTQSYFFNVPSVIMVAAVERVVTFRVSRMMFFLDIVPPLVYIGVAGRTSPLNHSQVFTADND
jgi:hypothetical protein